jgi:type IV secretory pathway VirB10-like protein
VTLRPPLPVATRLNRVALGLIGVLVAVTAIVGVQYVATSGGGGRPTPVDSVVAVPQRPSFPVPAPVPVPIQPTAQATPAPTPAPTPPLAAQPHPRFVTDITERQPGHNRLVVSVDSLASRYMLTAGTILSATLITEINSDLPGTVVAQLDRDVYDSRTGRTVLIPRGTRVIGRYESHLSVGQRRLMVVWTRLVFPDSRELALPDLAAIDAHGAAGLSDVTDDHLPRVFGTALLLSAVGAGAQLSQPSSGSALTTPSASQVAAGAVGQQMSGTALDVLRRNADVPPTITARAGLPFHLILAHDLVLGAPYVDQRR